MALHQLEHFLIQTTDIDATREWYQQVLGLVPGPAPEFHFPVCWMYIGDTAVLHIAQGGADVGDNRMSYLGQQSSDTHGSGVIDHVAFKASDLAGTLRHFEALDLQFATREISENGLFQVFVIDPNGVKVELNFYAQDAKGIKAQMSTADLA